MVPGTPSIESWLHPDGWSNERRDWQKIAAALDAMKARYAYMPVPVPGGGRLDYATLVPSGIPRGRDVPVVEFSVRIPRGAARGARLHWGRLCAYGKESATLYRADLSVAAHLDMAAHHGHPITREIHPPVLDAGGNPRRYLPRKGTDGKAVKGAIIRDKSALVPNESARFVRPLTDADLARMIGYDPEDKRRRHDARGAFERLHADGVIELVREAGGLVRVFGPSRR